MWAWVGVCRCGFACLWERVQGCAGVTSGQRSGRPTSLQSHLDDSGHAPTCREKAPSERAQGQGEDIMMTVIIMIMVLIAIIIPIIIEIG